MPLSISISVIEWRMSFTKILFKRICKFVLLKKYPLRKSNDVFLSLQEKIFHYRCLNMRKFPPERAPQDSRFHDEGNSLFIAGRKDRSEAILHFAFLIVSTSPTKIYSNVTDAVKRREIFFYYLRLFAVETKFSPFSCLPSSQANRVSLTLVKISGAIHLYKTHLNYHLIKFY